MSTNNRVPITRVEERDFVKNLAAKPVEEIKRRVSIQNERKKNKTFIFRCTNINLNVKSTTERKILNIWIMPIQFD